MMKLLTSAILLMPICAAVGEQPQSSSPLAGLPSSPGPHVEKIASMGDGEWLDLGAPSPDPKWGLAPGRAYTNKMAYAPDLVGAFLQGEGVHGAHGTGPREGHFNDDVFFYDLMAHRYKCLYPGTKTETFDVRRDKTGFIADEHGNNLPIAIAVHGYECSTYDPVRRQFMTLATGSPYSKKIQARLTTMVEQDPFDSPKTGGQHPFFYDVKSGRWLRRKVDGKGPRTGFADALTWIPSLNRTVLYQRGGDFWFYDNEHPAWNRVSANGERPTTVDGRPSREGTLCYDSKRDRLYIFNRGQISSPWVYDIKTNTFTELQAKNQFFPPTNSYEQGKIAIGSTASGVHYDSVADVVVMRLVIKQGTGDPRNIPGKRMGLAVYDPTTNQWTKSPVALPPAAQVRGAWNSFYSPELNVHVYHIARDSRTNGRIVLYRHKRK